jgi:hypothetical protein
MPQIQPFSRTRIIIALLCGLTALVVTVCNVWSEWPGDDPQAIREVSGVIERFVQGYAKDTHGRMSADTFLSAPSWNEVEATADRLGYPNRNIARAKALVVLDRHPEPYSDYEWKNRFERAIQSYRECSRFKRVGISLGFGALAAGAAILASWLLLLLFSWIWYFGLDRIRELSMAVRG